MSKSKRLLALDVFRGLTIGLMIVVNNPGSWEFVYAPLRHSKWHGCTPTDLVFPFFLFIVGTAMWYSFKKFNHSLSKGMVIKILRRTVVIFIIGLALNAYGVYSFELSSLRIMGVLQRIALAYGISSFIVLSMPSKYVSIVIGIILMGYWAILIVFGGDMPFSLEGNFVSRFDIFLLGEGHIPVFSGVKFDQTGLLSTLPSIGNVLFGYLAGRLIDQTESKAVAVKRLILFGIAAVIVAMLWGLVFPINKPLWTSSFVVYTSGLAMVLLGIMLWIIDIKGYKKWSLPFQVFGMNPLFIYVLSIVLAITFRIECIHSGSGELVSITVWLFSRCFEPLAGNMLGSLFYALSMTMVSWFVGWILFKRRIFIKI